MRAGDVIHPALRERAGSGFETRVGEPVMSGIAGGFS